MKLKTVSKTALEQSLNDFRRLLMRVEETNPMIDLDRVSELKSEVGEEDFAEVLEMFLEEVEEVLARLESASPIQLLDDLHFLKGSALNVGMSAFSEFCRQAEVSLRADSSSKIDTIAIHSAFENSKIAFLQHTQAN